MAGGPTGNFLNVQLHVGMTVFLSKPASVKIRSRRTADAIAVGPVKKLCFALNSQKFLVQVTCSTQQSLSGFYFLFHLKPDPEITEID